MKLYVFLVRLLFGVVREFLLVFLRVKFQRCHVTKTSARRFSNVTQVTAAMKIRCITTPPRLVSNVTRVTISWRMEINYAGRMLPSVSHVVSLHADQIYRQTKKIKKAHTHDTRPSPLNAGVSVPDAPLQNAIAGAVCNIHSPNFFQILPQATRALVYNLPAQH